MDEKQLKKINDSKENDVQKGNVSVEKPDSGKKNVEWLIVGLALGFMMVVVGFFIWNKFIQKQNENEKLRNQIESLQNKDNLTGNTASDANFGSNIPAGTVPDEYAGWKTYTNVEVGYSLKYPADWTIKEISGKSEITEEDVKYITIDTPSKKYFLYFGLKGKNDSFSISDRTGVGAGDIKEAGTTTILDTNVAIKQLSYKNKINEIFFGAIGQVTSTDGKYVFSSTFSSREDTYNGPGINPNLPEIEIAKKILGTVKIIEKSAVTDSDCSSSFTQEEQLNMKGWKTLTNSKYGYSFKYPNDWQVKDTSSDNVVLSDKDNVVTFNIKSNMSGFGIENYKLGSEKNMKIACKDATVTSFIADPIADPSFSGNERMMLTSFEKNGAVQTIFFTYKDLGASLSSDIVEGFYLTMKSIK